MDQSTTLRLKESTARAKVLLDANVLIYAHEAYEATGLHLLSYLDRLHGQVDWFVGTCVALKLHNGGTYDIGSFGSHLLNCQDIGMKMNQFPFIKEDDSLSFVRLSTLASDDCAQIFLAYNNPDLIIVTNDSRMFKTAHAVLRGRSTAFHDFIQGISPHWFAEIDWLKLKQWLMTNKKPLKNNSSWIIEGQKQAAK